MNVLPVEWWQVHQPTKRARAVSASTLLCICAVAASLEAGSAAASAQTNAHYETRTAHSADGIGKFYMGREIAHVMGHEAADWLERPERDTEEHTDSLVEQLGLRPGEVVADIGAGSGYFSRRLARKVLPNGKVLAVDIQPEMLTLLTNHMAVAGISNVFPVLGTPTNPCLPASSVDLALLVDVYHEFDFPFEMIQRICEALRPGGRLVFVEYRAEDPTVPIKPLHKMSELQVKKEMAPHPLVWTETLRRLPRQHMLFFRKQAHAPSPPNAAR
jgi:SAM-dependent methyltransferase